MTPGVAEQGPREKKAADVTTPPIAVAVMWIALILAMTAGLFYVVRKWAGKTGQDRPGASEMLSEFRELHARGGLSDLEYRRIKALLAPALQLEAEGAASAGVMAEATASLREAATRFDSAEINAAEGIVGPLAEGDATTGGLLGAPFDEGAARRAGEKPHGDGETGPTGPSDR